MVLENFIKWTISTVLKSFANTDIGTNNYGGNITQFSTYSSYYINSSSGRYVDIGFGDTPETQSDYKLADSNACDTPTLTWVSSVESRDYPSIRTVTSTYRNDTGSDVIVKEVGMVTHGGGASNNAYNALLTRKVLDTPVTVAAGEVKAFTVSLDV